MPRFSAGARTGTGSNTLPAISLYAAAAVKPRIVEIGLFNTTATAVALSLSRLTTAGTQGTGLTEAEYDADAPAPSASAFNTHSVAPTLGDDLGYRAVLGAAIGAGVIWTFGEHGLVIPVGTANGIGVIIPTGTGQILDAYVVWDE